MEERLKEALSSLFVESTEEIDGTVYRFLSFRPKEAIGDGSFSLTLIERDGVLLLADYCADSPSAKENPECKIKTIYS